jgi:hypothetical protein
MSTQLRDYRVRPEVWEQFLDAWAAPSESRLVWFLSLPGTVQEFEAADRAYYDSDERIAFDPDPREFLERADHFFVDRISPPR